MTKLVFTFWCLVYEKLEYTLNRTRYNYEIHGIFQEINETLCSMS